MSQVCSPERAPAVAGYFYPGEPDKLAATVKSLLNAAERPGTQEIIDKPLMIMVPHAGYIYSGKVAAECLARTRLPETVFLLGPNHTGKGQRLSVWPGGCWRTPLGSVPVDEGLVKLLTDSDAGFAPDTAAHVGDHCLEVVLPFLQVLVPTVRIVPISVAWPDLKGLKRAAEVLTLALEALEAEGRAACMLVSSDMSHFLRDDNARSVDAVALERLLALDPEGLFNTVLGQRISMCGVLPATLALFAANMRGAAQARQTAYATSGDVSGDKGRVVGYSSVIVW